MAVSKVIYDNNTLIDLTEDTVSADVLLAGYTAHNAAGEVVNGAAVIPKKNVWYGNCQTSGTTSAKAVTTDSGDFALEAGNIVVVYFRYACSTSSPTLNVDGLGAKAIYVSGTGGTSGSSFSAYAWQAGTAIAFVYDGSQFRPIFISSPATTTYYGLTKLSSAINSTSMTMAATPSAVKQAYDLANAKAARASYTATLSASWSGTSAPYTQEISVSGILATDEPHITPIYSSTNATAILEKKAWNMVGKAVTSAGKITFTCFEEKPEQAVSLKIEVIR